MDDNVDLIRKAYEAYARGDEARALQIFDSDLEWTFRDASVEDPEPQVCRGRHELVTALRRQAERGLETKLDAIMANGDRVMVEAHTPGIETYRAGETDDRTYVVFTVREGRIVAVRDCRDREEAMAAAGIGIEPDADA